MIDSKTRAFLRAQAQKLDPVVYIGKEGISENIISQIDGVLGTRELVKISILSNSEVNPKTALNEIADVLGAEPVVSIGRKMVLYKYSKKVKPHVLEPFISVIGKK